MSTLQDIPTHPRVPRAARGRLSGAGRAGFCRRRHLQRNWVSDYFLTEPSDRRPGRRRATRSTSGTVWPIDGRVIGREERAPWITRLSSRPPGRPSEPPSGVRLPPTSMRWGLAPVPWPKRFGVPVSIRPTWTTSSWVNRAMAGATLPATPPSKRVWSMRPVSLSIGTPRRRWLPSRAEQHLSPRTRPFGKRRTLFRTRRSAPHAIPEERAGRTTL